MNLEINFYINGETLNFKDKLVKDTLKHITSQIFSDNFKTNQYFNFSLSKNDKTIKNLIQTEDV